MTTQLSDMIFDIKQKLTDGEYKKIMDKLGKINNTNTDLYKVTYLEISTVEEYSPYKEDEDCSIVAYSTALFFRTENTIKTRKMVTVKKLDSSEAKKYMEIAKENNEIYCLMHNPDHNHKHILLSVEKIYKNYV